MPNESIEPTFRCPYCGARDFPVTKSKVSTGGWVVFTLLLVTVFLCWLCWLGLFIRDEYRVCNRCGMKLG